MQVLAILIETKDFRTLGNIRVPHKCRAIRYRGKLFTLQSISVTDEPMAIFYEVEVTEVINLDDTYK